VVETTAIPRKNPSASTRTIDGQAVIPLADQAQIYILNDVGTRVWNLIDGRRTFEEIVALVRGQLPESEYDGVPSDIARDVEEFLEDIALRGMITMDLSERS
jgi:hypothetical protein